jgi:serine/threonine protein phosphatase PrpC
MKGINSQNELTKNKISIKSKQSQNSEPFDSENEENFESPINLDKDGQSVLNTIFHNPNSNISIQDQISSKSIQKNLNFSLKDINKVNTSINISIIQPSISIINNNINTIKTNPDAFKGNCEEYTFKVSENDNSMKVVTPKNEKESQIMFNHFFDANSSNSNFFQNKNKHMQKKEIEDINKLIKHIKNNPIIFLSEKFGIFSGFSAYTYKNFENINEDKIGIKINYEIESQKINYFGIYDGNNGNKTSIYLQENLSNTILNNKKLLLSPIKTILESYDLMESNIISNLIYEKENNRNIKTSGSTSLNLLNIDQKIYIINLGDSQGIISIKNSQKINELCLIHNLLNDYEKERINKINSYNSFNKFSNNNFINGISATRSFGNIENKFPKYGGKLYVISSVPDIFSFEWNNDIDFIILGSKYIFKALSNKDLCVTVYESMLECIKRKKNYDIFLKKIVINIMEKCVLKGIKGNISCVFLCNDRIKKLFELKKQKIIRNIITTLSLSNQNYECLYDNFIERKLYIFKNKNNINYNNNNNNNNENNNFNKNESHQNINNSNKNESNFQVKNQSQNKLSNTQKQSNMKNVIEFSNNSVTPVTFTFKKKKKKILCCGCL